jgi:hypothetical protein
MATQSLDSYPCFNRLPTDIETFQSLLLLLLSERLAV